MPQNNLGVVMGFVDAIRSGISKYSTWQGRATRSEYWYFVLFYIAALVSVVAIMAIFEGIVGDAADAFFGLIFIAILIFFVSPMLAVSIRRLHDINRSGWWYWINLIPYVGAIVFIVFMCTRGDHFINDYGDNPISSDTDTILG